MCLVLTVGEKDSFGGVFDATELLSEVLSKANLPLSLRSVPPYQTAFTFGHVTSI
jgi:hypothetical protein